jgi:hypothetical protein
VPAALDKAADRLFAETTQCRAELAGHTVIITYPGTWWTNDASGDVPGCIWFGPEPIEPYDSDPLARPANTAIAFGAAGGPFEPSSGPAVSEDVTIAGREGIRVEHVGEAATEGDGLLRLFYEVALGETPADGPTLFAVTRQEDLGDYALNKAVLDRMMELLVIE